MKENEKNRRTDSVVCVYVLGDGVMKALILVINEFQRGPYKFPQEATGPKSIIVS